MPPEPFDPALYTRAPVLTIGSAISLSRTLLDVCPKAMPTNVKKSAKKLKTAVDVAEDAWTDRQREIGVVSDEDSRALDQFTDNLWGALRSRLLAFAVLPADDFPRAPRAGELVVVLFGADGLGFLKEKYPVQLASMTMMIKRIDADALKQEIDDLAGPEFLQAIRKMMPRYDAMVTAMLMRDDASGQNLSEHVRAIQRAIVDYATKVCATVDDDEPETAEIARQALRPINAVRDMAAPTKKSTPSAPEEGKGETPGTEPPK